MGLTRNAFNVLAALVRDNVRTQRDIADASGLSLGVVNREYRELADKGLVDEAQVTPAGFTALSPYRVENAVIMAAGLSSRFAPLSYERPKGCLLSTSFSPASSAGSDLGRTGAARER